MHVVLTEASRNLKLIFEMFHSAGCTTQKDISKECAILILVPGFIYVQLTVTIDLSAHEIETKMSHVMDGIIINEINVLAAV